MIEMYMANWDEAQKEDPMLSTVLEWLKAKKQTDLKNTFGLNHKNFTVHQGALYLCSMPRGKSEDLLLFVVPKDHCTATLNGCH